MQLQEKEQIDSERVFIVGVLNRSGTNFLSDIILLVDHFEMPILKEDYVIEHSKFLIDYEKIIENREKKAG